MAYKKVYLKPGKEESLKRFHPWVFSGAIQRIEGEPEEGEIVDVYTSKKEFIACGHFQIGSIAVRVLSFKEGEIDHEFCVHVLFHHRKTFFPGTASGHDPAGRTGAANERALPQHHIQGKSHQRKSGENYKQGQAGDYHHSLFIHRQGKQGTFHL